ASPGDRRGGPRVVRALRANALRREPRYLRRPSPLDGSPGCSFCDHMPTGQLRSPRRVGPYLRNRHLPCSALRGRRFATGQERCTTMRQTTPEQSTLDRFFKISERGSTVGQEVRGGLVTFFAMAYIIVLKPLIIGTVPDSTGTFLGGG